MSDQAESATARIEQKRRTRAAIVDAATALVAQGHTPTVGEIARAARVSRRTIYDHFPNHEHLILDATIGAVSQPAVDQALVSADRGATGAERTIAMATALSEQSEASLPLGRQLIKLMVAPDRSGPAGVPLRGQRRVNWIATALEPLEPTLTPQTYQRLTAAMAVVAGWEALITLQDVCALSVDERADQIAWMLDVLVRAATEADAAQQRPE